MDAVSLLQVGTALLLNLGFAWLVGSWFARYWLRWNGHSRSEFEPALRELDLWAAGLTALFALLSAFVTPPACMAAMLLLPHVGDLRFEVLKILIILMATITGPLLLGVAIHHLMPAMAQR